MLSAQNIANGRIDTSPARLIAEVDFEREDARTCIRPGSVLLTIVGAIGRSAVVDFSALPFVVQRSVAVIEPEGVDPYFLSLQFRSPLFQRSLEANARGTAQKGVYLGTLARLPLVVPPIEEQRRIVAKVEALLARVNAARDRLARVPAILKRFRQSVLAAACSGRLTEDWRSATQLDADGVSSGQETPLRPVPDDDDPLEPPKIPASWRWSRLVSAADPERPITYGVIKLGPPVQDGVPTLRSSDVRWLRLETDEIKRIAPAISGAYSRTILRGGEILITVRGTLGGVAVVPLGVAESNVSREVAVIAPIPDVEAEFLALAVASPWAQAWLTEVTKGVAYSGVNIRDLKRLPVPVAPLAEQREIVRRVGTLFALADTIEQRAATALRRADRLTQSILSKAFRGELVSSPQP